MPNRRSQKKKKRDCNQSKTGQTAEGKHRAAACPGHNQGNELTPEGLRVGAQLSQVSVSLPGL